MKRTIVKKKRKKELIINYFITKQKNSNHNISFMFI